MPTASMATPGRRPSPSRRMTLGPTPSSKTNRRMSVEPSSIPNSVQKNSQRRPPKGRASMIPRVGRENLVPPSPAAAPKTSNRRTSVGGDRRQSVGGGDRRQSLLPPSSSSAANRADPRPLQDKTFQQQCIRKLMTFLKESGYEFPLSIKSLQRPSGKDFTQICTYLLRLIDPGFQVDTTMKFEDEVSMAFRSLGYPYTVSKTALVAAGSPHTWPTLLAALCWLQEQIECQQAERPIEWLHETQPFENVQELELNTDRVFFHYLGLGYPVYMRGESEEPLEEALADRFQKDDALLFQEVNRLSDLNASILDKIGQLAEGYEELPIYIKKRREYETDLEQFHDLIRQMHDHKSALEVKVKERSTELTETNAKLEKMNIHVKDLKTTIETQKLSVDDLRKIESELKGIREARDRTRNLRDKRHKALSSHEKELMNITTHLDSSLQSYNAFLSDVQDVLPIRTNKAKLDQTQLLESDQERLLGVKLSSEVLPALIQTMGQFRTKVDTTKSQYQDDLDTQVAHEETAQEADAKRQIVRDKMTKADQTVQSEREAHEAKLAVRQREVDAMEEKVALRRDPVALEEQMAAFTRQCAELEALRRQHTEENLRKKQAVVQEIDAACRLMQAHEQHLHHKIQELEEYWNKKETTLTTVRAPTRHAEDDLE